MLTRNAESAVQQALSLVRQKPSEEVESDTLEFKEYESEKALHNAKDLAEEVRIQNQS